MRTLVYTRPHRLPLPASRERDLAIRVAMKWLAYAERVLGNSREPLTVRQAYGLPELLEAEIPADWIASPGCRGYIVSDDQTAAILAAAEGYVRQALENQGLAHWPLTLMHVRVSELAGIRAV